MPLRCSVLLLPILCTFALNQCFGETRPEDAVADNVVFNETVRRHFASQRGYHEGDLITRSQIEELQGYLRSAFGHSAATHPRALRRILADDSRLASLFYKKNRGEILRALAAQNKGYEVFDRISRTTAGYARLTEAVDHAEVGVLNQLADEESQKTLSAKSGNSETPVRRSKPTPIYTVEEYLAAFQSVVKKGKSTAKAKVSE